MVGGGMAPATNFTRQDVQRPRPPQVAVMSTPRAWAARRMVLPGSTWSVIRSGRMVRPMLMRGRGYHSGLDFPPPLVGIVAGRPRIGGILKELVKRRSVLRY